MRKRCYLVLRHFAKWPAIALILPVMGCFAIKTAYPPAWPQVKQSDDIEAQIEGAYNCNGHIVTSGTAGDDPKSSAADFLIASNKSTSRCIDLTILRPRPDEIEISLLSGGEPAQRLVYRKGKDYRIEGNWIVLRSTGFFSASAYHVGHTSVEPYISISSEGDLIMKSKNTNVGALLFLIPLGGSGTDWGRFGRKE